MFVPLQWYVATYEFLGLVIGIMEDPKKDLSSLYCTCSMSREVSIVRRGGGGESRVCFSTGL